MEEHSLRDHVYLAALLHDIGKFYQRGDPSGSLQASTLVSGEAKDLMSTFCPPDRTRPGDYTRKHVVWTAQFFLDHRAVFETLFPGGSDELLRLAAAHHKPGSAADRLIQQADHYASALDRESAPEGQRDAADESGGWDQYRRKRMVNIFESLFRDDPEYEQRLPITALALEEAYFPQPQDDFDAPAPEQYQALWRAFTAEFKEGFARPERYDPRSFAETLLYLLEKHLATVPGSTTHLRDVSLYDHLKITGAFAVCLHDYLKAHGREKVAVVADETPVLLVGADLSGIQSFLYDIVGARAAKNLKGRSYYLHLLTESVLHEVLRTLDLYRANVVYASGGGFYVLAPHTPAVVEKLTKLREKLGDKLFAAHGTSLFLALDWLPLRHDVLIPTGSQERDLGTQWRTLGEMLGVRKRQRFSRQVLAYDALFDEAHGDVGAATQRDYITGEEIARNEDNLSFEEGRIKQGTYDQIELGKQLRSAKYRLLTDGPLPHWPNQSGFAPAKVRTWHYFADTPALLKQKQQLRASADRVRILSFNEPDFLNPEVEGKHNAHGFELYGGNDFPEDEEGGPKTFDELAGDEGDALRRLGVLRMDVDNLGQAFIRGFTPRQRTFSRYAALSRNLDFFFKGYLNTLWRDGRYTDPEGNEWPYR
ncbi:MAG: type III-A CRISPR-associated protein Cas10/Csm1, partial [Catalinimonas sp.]